MTYRGPRDWVRPLKWGKGRGEKPEEAARLKKIAQAAARLRAKKYEEESQEGQPSPTGTPPLK